MAFNRLVFSILLVTVSSYANNVPVFMWGDTMTPIKVKSLTQINNFGEIFEEELTSDPFTIVFIEPTLSPEDMSSKNTDGATPFTFLAQQVNSEHFSYLLAVENPVEAIEQETNPTEVERINLTKEGLSAEIKSNRKFLFISLNDALEDESRVQLLERHNKFMEDIYGKLRENHENVLAIYTGLAPSWIVEESHSRIRRQAAPTNQSDDFILDGVRMFVEQVVLTEGGQEYVLTETPTSSMVLNNETDIMNTTVTFGERSFIMNFRERNGYWYFDSITFNKNASNEETIYPTTDVFALTSFSYRCGQKTVFRNVWANTTRTVTFIDMQIQPYFGPINDTVQFGYTFDCVGFFTGPIWAGLMVTFILLAITFYGIMMMMDIRTMDRFDDPKGKTITINAVE